MSNVTRQMQDKAQQAGEKAKDAANTAYDKAKDMAGQAGEAIGSAASTVGRKAEDATATAGGGMQSLAGTVREQGPQSGMLGQATRGVASALEQGGKYLEDKNLSGMADDLTNLIRHNPIPAVLIGLGVGFLLGRAIRS
jgi:ElaB/YqjD/DUF883 family membrane-anchored ribosome-binding protein